ncbi:DNA-3-methyladenine glycosylase [Bombiscardovia coagulans]|uniref:Putative 3-methyladenine DNA glycosylase n=1 Tax=Bombiscardovia coagulans TaxID=686666 RepID=A0A261ETP3_9BIFI|nr:DNA-3-methyladenine glycosylase [Bombiscardovia coagulans]OZG50195.1 DNA-3-methyladenine glycosylase [Bombiscardovia coagulans]
MRVCTISTISDFPDFLDAHVEQVAQRLLGCLMVRSYEDGSQSIVRIVETEAYDQEDPASHAFHGMSARNRTLFGPSGRLYVYFTYGMHYCCNVSCDREGYGAGVLIRAAEPVEGINILQAHRKGKHSDTNLTNGPAKLCQAIAVDSKLDGHDLRQAPLRLVYGRLHSQERIEATPRIGISKAKDTLRRFIIAGNPYIS